MVSSTKIVATVGPACSEVEQLTELVMAGADVFRLNMAHGGPERQQVVVDRIRQVSRDLNQPIAILADLGGPKIRLGEIPGESIFCRRGEEFFFVDGEEVLLNELNTMPGFTQTSVYGKLWEASGLAYPDLVDRLVTIAVERHERERAYRF